MKKTYNSVELASLISLRPSKVILALTRAELPEVLSRLRDHVLEELKGDAAEGLAAEGDVEEDSIWFHIGNVSELYLECLIKHMVR